MNGHPLAQDPNGYDSEGLVAMKDGTFWVSDEYGPFITHFSASGRAIKRLSPLDGTLPAELANRIPNKGMEGLTITPNGKLLVGLMQSALQQPDLGSSNAKKLTPTRIVTYNLKTGAVHEYLYLLHDPATTGTANSEITALSNTQFLVDERDGNFATPSAPAFKRLYKIDLTGATDVGPDSTVPGATYGSSEGLTIGGHSIEDLTLGENTAAAQSTLASRRHHRRQLDPGRRHRRGARGRRPGPDAVLPRQDGGRRGARRRQDAGDQQRQRLRNLQRDQRGRREQHDGAVRAHRQGQPAHRAAGRRSAAGHPHRQAAGEDLVRHRDDPRLEGLRS